jgi:putative acetyltransferase
MPADASAIRPIQTADDPAMAAIIRAVMTEHGASGPGFAIHDREVDAMSAAYDRPGAGYFVVEAGAKVVGGGGFAPLDGGAPGTCELRKMYFLPATRGLGLGAALLGRCLEAARRAGHRQMYLETLDTMGRARRLYEGFGFQRLDGPLGCTGHHACDTWYARPL